MGKLKIRGEKCQGNRNTDIKKDCFRMKKYK